MQPSRRLLLFTPKDCGFRRLLQSGISLTIKADVSSHAPLVSIESMPFRHKAKKFLVATEGMQGQRRTRAIGRVATCDGECFKHAHAIIWMSGALLAGLGGSNRPTGRN